MFASVLAALLLILVTESALFPGVWEAYAKGHISQTRSTQGRLEIWNRSYEVIRAHPIWGVGSGNAALALTSTAEQEETTGFASRTFSLPIQMLVEKGIIGFLAYATFLFLLAREFVRTMRSSPPGSAPSNGSTSSRDTSKQPNASRQDDSERANGYKAMVGCFAAGLVAVLFRELTYSSLMEHNLTLVLFATLSAFTCRPEAAA